MGYEEELKIMQSLRDGMDLEDVPEDWRTERICLVAVKTNPTNLKDVPPDKRNETICFAALIRNGDALQYIPVEKRTYNMCLIAAESDGSALQYVPTEHETEELYLSAVTLSPNALRHVPKPKISYAICLTAVENNGAALEFVPNDMKKDEICLKAVEKDGSAIAFIPANSHLLTYDLCLKAVKNNGLALKTIVSNAPDYLTMEICLEAVKQDGTALIYAPLNMRIPDIYLAAVTSKGRALQYVPPNMRTKELCLIAIETGISNLSYLPDELKTEEIYLKAIEKSPLVYTQIPKDKRTYPITLATVKKNGLLLSGAPSDQLTNDVCTTAVKQNGNALFNMPAEKRTAEISLLACEQNGLVLGKIPFELQTDDMIIAAIKQNGLALQFLPPEKKSPEICLESYHQNKLAYQFIPENLRESVLNHPREILSEYDLHPLLPAHYEKEKDLFLANIEHIVLTDFEEYEKDFELKDIYAVYANHPKRKGKVIHINSDEAPALLTQMNKDKKLNIVILGHANQDVNTIGGLSAQQITAMAVNYPNIDKITLLGCNTAKAKALNAEIDMIKKYNALRNAIEPIGLINLTQLRNIEEDDIRKYLTSAGVNDAYLIQKQGEVYYLIHGQINKNEYDERVVTCSRHMLSEQDLEKIKKMLGFGPKKPLCPKVEGQVNILKDNKKPLNEKESDLLLSINPMSKREEMGYSAKKKKYPYYNTMKINEDEANEKLISSLLKRMFSALKRERDAGRLKQEISLKGYLRSLHVDTAMRRMEVTRTHLYTGSYHQSRFYAMSDNIDRKKLEEERKKVNAAMESEQIDESISKAVTIKLGKSKA